VAVIGPNGELSVIVTRLGCESVVCLDSHTQWLHRLYVLVLFFYSLLLVEFDERRTHPCNHHVEASFMMMNQEILIMPKAQVIDSRLIQDFKIKHQESNPRYKIQEKESRSNKSRLHIG